MLVINLFQIFIVDDNPIICSPSNKPNVSSSQSQTEHAEIKNSSKGNHNSLTSVEDGVNITYQGFNIFRKTLVIIVEPLDKIIEFGDNIQIATA